MENYKFGRLQLVGKSKEKHKDGTYFHQFLCDCGNTKLALLRNVKYGYTRSCGCLQSEGASSRLIGKCPTNKRNERDRAISWSFQLYKNSAKQKNREFSLTLEDISDLVFKNCFYCGSYPSRLIKHTRDCSEVKVPVNGLDRFMNNVGYTKDNVRTCCADCNYLKSDTPGPDFLNKIRKIYDNCFQYMPQT